jgi:sialate O-acetylesterase
MEVIGMRGLIWYHGESNTGNHSHYGPRLAALIRGWREAWKRDFPFFFVQLANYGKPQSDPNEDGGWPRVREAQRQTLSLPHTAMAVAIDVNPENDPHPPNKYEVGRRLTLPARALVSGEKVAYSGPHCLLNGCIHFEAVGIFVEFLSNDCLRHDGDAVPL